MQDCLGGTAATMLICNVSPGSKSYQETLSSLRFADRVKHVKNDANVVHRVYPGNTNGGGGGGGGGGQDVIATLQKQVVALQRSLLASNRENQALKSELLQVAAKHQVNAWCPNCDAPLNNVNV